MDNITFNFKNRTALVTGGAQGFGFDIAGDHTDIKGLMKNFPNYKKSLPHINKDQNAITLGTK